MPTSSSTTLAPTRLWAPPALSCRNGSRMESLRGRERGRSSFSESWSLKPSCVPFFSQPGLPELPVTCKKMPWAGRETVMSDHDADDWGQLPFEILTVHEGRTPAKEPPFHADGGERLFLECRAGAEEPVLFTVGVLTR